jgi:cell division protein FtsB
MITRTTFQRPLARLFIVGVSLLTVVSLSRSVYGLWRKRDYVRIRADALAQEQAENDRLKKLVEEAQKPEFIEKEAREKLGMTREGEAIVILPKSQISNPNDQVKQKEENISNWKKWWRLFF